MYNVTFRRIHETTDAMEKQKVLHISVCVCVAGVCLLAYLHSMTSASAIWSVAFLATSGFWTLSHKRHDLRKKSLNIKCVF
jgi:hypothetical protein